MLLAVSRTPSFSEINVAGRSAHHDERTTAVDRPLPAILILAAIEGEIAAQSAGAAGRIQVYGDRFRQSQIHVASVGNEFRISARLFGQVRGDRSAFSV